MAGTVLGGLLVNITNAILPFILSFAGGTMLYVVSDEMIPETHSHGFEKAATFSMIAGFLFILVMQKVLGA
jgi:ZIP family zinc transporter